MRVIVDTNVVLDVLLEREPFVQAAVDVFCLAEHSQIQAFLCTTTITTIDYLLMRSLPAAKARKAFWLSSMHSDCEPVATADRYPGRQNLECSAPQKISCDLH